MYTRRRLKVLGTLLEHVGIDPKRFQVKWISASEGGRFADVVNEMTDNVRKLGPNSAFKREVLNECH
jgi:coenzyme F420-reducing hydrogenase delta subunit